MSSDEMRRVARNGKVNLQFSRLSSRDWKEGMQCDGQDEVSVLVTMCGNQHWPQD